MSQNLNPQQVLTQAVDYFTAEPAAVSCIGELDANTRFVAENDGAIVTVKIFEKREGCAGFALVETLQAPLVESVGSLGVIAGLEYYTHENGDLYRAPIANVLDCNGYRLGGRWQVPARMAQSQFEMIARAV